MFKSEPEQFIKNNDYHFNSEERIDLCIVCCTKVPVSNTDDNHSNSSNLLSRNLSVVFLLRNLLQVPDSQLEDNLRECGDPVSWLIRLCEDCRELTRQAEQLHWQIVKIKEQLKCVQQLIVDKTKVPSVTKSSCSSNYDNKWGMNGEGGRERIWRRTRAFISTHYYASPICPFVDGDELASQLVDKKQDSSLNNHLIKVEVEHLAPEEEVEYENPSDGLPCEDANWEGPEVESINGEDDQVGDPFIADIIATKPTKRKKYEKVNRKRGRLPVNKKPLPRDLCKTCGKSFKTADKLKEHVRIVHEKQFKVSCHLCGHGFARQARLNLHLLFKHKDEPETRELKEKGYQIVRCKVPKCTAYFTKESSLEEHMKKWHSSFEHIVKTATKFACQFCGKILNCKITLKHHEQSVHENGGGGMKRFKCDLCEKGFISSISLDGHKRLVHNFRKRRGPNKKTTGGKRVNKEVETICHLCGKIYKARSNMRRHLVSNHPEDPLAKKLIEEGFGVWRCRVPGCGNVYVHKNKLEEHVEGVHGGKDGEEAEFIFFCAFCGKGFRGRQTLQLHEKLFHEGNIGGGGKFKCEVCGFETAFQSYLDGHVQRVHRPGKDGEVKGDKVVICTICGMQFYEKDKLEKHKIIHDKEAEQPHACDLCGRAYSTNESMWKHKRKIHKIYRKPDDSRIKR